MHSPSNIGMVMRICEAFGVSDLYFTGPYANTSSEKYRKAARSSEKYIRIYTNEDTASVIHEARSKKYKIIAIEITETSKRLSDYNLSGGDRLALILGSERHGVNAGTLALCDESLHIQQYGRTGSLNVGTALSIVLYQMSQLYHKAIE